MANKYPDKMAQLKQEQELLGYNLLIIDSTYS